MSHPFVAGQRVRFLPNYAGNDAKAAFLGLDMEQSHVVRKAPSVYHPNGDRYFVMLEGVAPGFETHALKVDRFESEAEWAKHQAPAAAILNRAEGAHNQMRVPDNLSLGFVSARQEAWDAYVASRAKANLLTVRNSPRHSGFLAGFEAGRQSAVVEGSATPLAALLRPLSRAGEAAPAITKGKALKIADAILMDLQTNGPATAEQIAKRIGRALNSVSPRFAGLVRGERIHVAAGVGNRSVYKFGKRD